MEGCPLCPYDPFGHLLVCFVHFSQPSDYGELRAVVRDVRHSLHLPAAAQRVRPKLPSDHQVSTSALRALHVIQANTLVYDRLEGCEDLVDTAQGVSSDPGAYANKTYRDMNDFKNYPDKSKEPQKDYTWTELITLDGENGHHLCLVIDRNVYDFTDFADQHPAGPKGLKKYVGCDADHGLQRCGILPGMIKPVLQLFKIGQLAPSETDSYAYDDQGFSCDSRN